MPNQLAASRAERPKRVAGRVRNALARIIRAAGVLPLFGAMLPVLVFSAGEAGAQTWTLVPSSVPENVGTAVIAITNTSGATRTNSTWATSNGTATAGSDYSTVFNLVGANVGNNASMTARIAITNDGAREDAETFNIVVISSPAGGSAVTTTLPLTIEKNDQPTATLTMSPISNVEITEGAAQDFTVTLSPAQTVSTSVFCQTLGGGSAVAGEDYTELVERLTFAAGETTKTCSLATIDDSNSEDDSETVFFGLQDFTGGPPKETDGSGGLTVPAAHRNFSVSILDNDQPASALTFPDGSINVDEDAGAAMVRVNLAATRPIISNVTVRCQTANSSAVAPGDFTAVDQLLTFAPSDNASTTTDYTATKTCSIPIVDDDLNEDGLEAITVSLSGPTGGATVPNAIDLRIVDNDGPPTISMAVAEATVSEGTATYDITLNLSPASGKDSIAVGYRLSGTATPGYDGNLTPPESGEDYTVSYSRMATSSLTAQTVVGTESFSGFRRTDGTGHIIIAAGETAKTITVHVNDDQLKELDETIVFELSGDTNALDGTVDATRNSTALTLRDDDGGGANVVWYEVGGRIEDARGVNEADIPEGDGAGDNLWIAFQPQLDVDSPPSTIGLTVRGGTAAEGEDYMLTPFVTPTLGHISGGAYEAFAILILHDEESEGREYFEIVLDDSAGNLLAEPFRAFIDDDDGPDQILREVAMHSIARAEALLENQPRLIPMLRYPGAGSDFSLRVDDGGARSVGGGFQAETVWGATTLSRTVDDGREHEHLLTTLGAHFQMSERLHLGGMLQFDRSGMKPGGEGASGEIGGRGWMAGPYFAMRDASQPLYFEGRLLYGRASNDIDALVLDAGSAARSASFDSERWLAQARVEGTYRLESGATLIPLADFSHARDEMEPFQDSGGVRLQGWTIALTKLQLGAELDIPVETARGDLRLMPGLRFVVSDATGNEFVGEDGKTGARSRGRIDFGIDYRLDDGLVLGFDSFYSGLGREELESYGAGLDLRLEF